MAHDGTGHGWDITAPADSDPRRLGAQEIRDLRTGVGIRMDKEHETLAPASAGGEHKSGSAKAYMQNSAPTTRPGGDSLSSDDKGRLWVRETDGVLHSYDGSQFIALSGGLDTVKLTGNQTVNGDKNFRGTTTVVSLRVNPQSDAIHEISGFASRLDLNPGLQTSDQNAQVGMFRQTNTTGEKSLQLFRGNGTTESSARIAVDGGDSWFQVHGGGVVIGSASRTSSAILDLNSTTMGFRPPRVTTTQRNNISNPASGLMVYNTSTTRFEFYTGSQWEPIGAGDNVVMLTGDQIIQGQKTFTGSIWVGASDTHSITATGATILDISPNQQTSTGVAQVRLFRTTNTTGSKTLTLARGNGSSSVSAQIGADGEETFFQLHGGGVTIGGSSRSGSAILDLQSTTMGFRPPRMTTTQRDAITSPDSGLMIFNTTANKTQIYNGSSWNDFDSTSLSFLDLDDTPSSYSGQGGKFLKVNSAGTAVEVTDSVFPDSPEDDPGIHLVAETPTVLELEGFVNRIAFVTGEGFGEVAGIEAPTSSQSNMILLLNDSPNEVVILEESLEANYFERIRTGRGDVKLQVGQSVLLYYDRRFLMDPLPPGVDPPYRWRLISSPLDLS